MTRYRPSLLRLAAVAAAAASGCGGDSPATPHDEHPPDLTGSYSLRSFSSALLTGGATLTLPEVSGALTMQQSSSGGAAASGSMTMSVKIPDGQGGTAEVSDQGTYTVRSDGTWEQRGAIVQAKGTYTLAGAILSVVVTEPPINASTTVWQRSQS